MVTLLCLVALEVALVVLPDSQFPDPAIAGLFAILLWAMVAVAVVDLNSGFLGRLGFLFATAWYIGSIGRWMVPMNDIYIAVGDMPGMTLALALLIVAPLGLLLVSIAGPSMHAWRRYRRGKG